MAEWQVVLLTAALTLLVFNVGAWSMRWWLRSRTPDEVRRGDKRCSYCGVALPTGTCRTSLGQWRCALHKETAA